MLAAFFSFRHIRAWGRRKGKFKIDLPFVLLCAALAFTQIPGSPLYGLLLWAFNGAAGVVTLLLWYSLFHAVKREEAPENL